MVVSMGFLLLITFSFIDFKQAIPSSWYNGILFLQFVPSVRKFLIAASFLAAGFAVVLALTLFFGRVYCSTICPLGIFQDIISFLSRKTRKKVVRFKYSKPYQILRYTFLGLAAAPLAIGSITLLYLLDPYSNFGRFASDFGRPLYILMNNVVARVLIKFKVYSLAPYDIAHFDVFAVFFPLLLLGLVVYLSVKRGRLYCNTVCPVGTFLGILSKISLFKIKMNQGSCTKCAKCAFVCKSECISIKEQSVDFTRCVGCFNCINVCDNGSITYKFAFAKPKSRVVAKQKTDESKRKFIASSILLTGALTGFSAIAKADKPAIKYRKNLTPIKKKHVCSPPGSISIDHFNDACTACHLCVSACPSGVLQPSLLEYGIIGFMQPYLDNHTNYCNIECVKCSEVCPTGAILPISKMAKKTCQIGQVHFIKTNCVVYTDETSCGACSEHCPTQAVKMVPYKGKLTIPEVNTELCIGCGACEHPCPVRPHRAIYVEGNPVHKISKKPVVKKIEEKQTEDFPF
jgi:ferredoxin